MKLVKTTLWNKMDDEFLANCLIIYIERELAGNIDSDSIINDFYSLKDCRVPLKQYLLYFCFAKIVSIVFALHVYLSFCLCIEYALRGKVHHVPP
jgi:hypothetical protein